MTEKFKIATVIKEESEDSREESHSMSSVSKDIEEGANRAKNESAVRATESKEASSASQKKESPGLNSKMDSQVSDYSESPDKLAKTVKPSRKSKDLKM